MSAAFPGVKAPILLDVADTRGSSPVCTRLLHCHGTGLLTNCFSLKRLCSVLRAEMEIGVIDWYIYVAARARFAGISVSGSPISSSQLLTIRYRILVAAQLYLSKTHHSSNFTKHYYP
jgi:hypothetical protein